MTTVMERLRVPHFIRGKTVWGEDVEYQSRDLGTPFFTPALKLGELFPPRSEPGPAFDTPLLDIIDFLVETGKHLALERNSYLQETLDMTLKVSPLPRRVVENTFKMPMTFSREMLIHRMKGTFGDIDVLDGWVENVDPSGSRSFIRAFPPRLVHIVAGNSPSACLMSIMDGALVKAVNLFKMPSADPFTMVAVLRTMADIDPDHPVVKSMSAVYWRGGDERIENVVYRSQYFDKLVAWGGGDTIRNAAKYVGPGFQLISFDPKVSIALVGREAFASDALLDEVAELVATDATLYNQDACVAPRQVYIEGSVEDADRFGGILVGKLGVDRFLSSAIGPKTPSDIREAVEGMRWLEPEYKIWGKFDGSGLVVRSPEPVDFHPTNKTVNIVAVDDLIEAARFATVATQTVGVFPPERKAGLRDRFAGMGVQRLIKMGSGLRGTLGGPQDGMHPMHRMVNWVNDDYA